MKTPRAWFRIVAQADGEVADLFIFDEIGASFWNDQAVTAKSFIDELQALPETVKTLRLHVNSPGGDPFDATAIANALRAQRTEKGRTVEVSIEGLAASAATIVTSAGDPIRIADNALLMVHDPSALVIGPAAEMRKMADLLDTVRDSIIATYRWVSDLSVESLAELMTATTWMDAKTALKNGFATEIVETVKVAASFRPEALARLGSIPVDYRERVEALVVRPAAEPPKPVAAAPKDVLVRCSKHGLLELAEPLLDAGATLETVDARLAAASEIRALCTTAKFPELAAGYIQAQTPADVVRAHLTTLGAKFDAIEIDGHLGPDRDPTSIQESWRRAVARVQRGGRHA